MADDDSVAGYSDGPLWWDGWERIVPEIVEAVQSRCTSGAAGQSRLGEIWLVGQ